MDKREQGDGINRILLLIIDNRLYNGLGELSSRKLLSLGAKLCL